MKKFLAAILLTLAIASSAFAANKTITVGVTPFPHKDIMVVVKDLLAKEGYNLDIKEFTDYVTPNTALAEKSLNANFFQHVPYLENTCKEKGFKLTWVAKVHIEPLGLYSQKIKKLTDLKKAESLGKSWRTGNALIQYYSTAKNWEEAYKVASKYYKQYPNNNVICLQYATTLNETGRYSQCHKLLKDVTILPNEGASYGHEVYRKAYLYEAIHSMLNGKNAEARKCIELSKLWPENLGVGKPYETGIDYSTEKFLEETSNHSSKEIPQLLKSSELKLIKDYFKK